MAGGRRTEVGNFALNPDIDEFALDELAHLFHKVADRPDATRRSFFKREIQLTS